MSRASSRGTCSEDATFAFAGVKMKNVRACAVHPMTVHGATYGVVRTPTQRHVGGGQKNKTEDRVLARAREIQTKRHTGMETGSHVL